MGGKLLRKQFSMYQNNESANYIFGGRYNEKSFAQDLIGGYAIKKPLLRKILKRDELIRVTTQFLQ